MCILVLGTSKLRAHDELLLGPTSIPGGSFLLQCPNNLVTCVEEILQCFGPFAGKVRYLFAQAETEVIKIRVHLLVKALRPPMSQHNHVDTSPILKTSH